ncbi:MAG: M14 family zinc carboxypeptidase [Eubacteriales bacterium]
MISISEKSAAGLKSIAEEVKIRHSAASDYGALMKYLDYMAVKHDVLSLSSIGKSTEGRQIPVVTLGKDKERGGDVYVGGMWGCDLVSPAVLLRFVCDYVDFLDAGRRVYGMSMQYLWEKRTIRVIPMLNPDGYIIRREGAEKSIICDRLKKLNADGGNSPDDFSKWKYNALGRDLTVSFNEENVPETDALKNYLGYYAESLDMTFDFGIDSGIVYSSGKIVPKRAKTVARLISRMSGYQIKESHSDTDGCLTDYVIKKLGRSAYHCGCLDEGEDAPSSGDDYIRIYAALREALFSCPLL